MLHILKYTKTFIKNILYNFNNTIVSALNFNILKTNLFKIASKEVKIYVFENYFPKKKELCNSYPCYLLCCFRLHIFYYEFNDFVFTLLNKFFRPSWTFSRHFLYFSLLFQMVVTIAFVGKWFVTN